MQRIFSHLPLRRRDASRQGNGEITFRHAAGRPFNGNPSYVDPRQGNIGDCYLLCALGAVARASPSRIRSMIRPAPKGTYLVRFFSWEYDDAPYAERVRVNGKVPVTKRNGRPLYARTESGHNGVSPTWPLIAEKAYAAWKGGYDVIGEGGMVEDTLEELTGQLSRVFYVAKTEPEFLWSLLQKATAENWPAAVCTYGRVAKPELDEFGFHPWHIHIFLGVHVWQGRRIVWLRDPFDHPQSGTTNLPDPNGVFTIAWEHFLNYFAEVIINHDGIEEIEAPPYPVVTIRKALERSYVFHPLPEAVKKKLASEFRLVRVDEGNKVFAHGATPDAYYLIRSGSASVWLPSPGACPRQVAVLEAGDQFGEMALISDTCRGADVRADTPLVLYRLSAAKFRSLLARFPELDARFRRRFAFQEWMEHWSKRPITSVSLDTLLESGEEIKLDAGETIIREGATAESFYLILEGEVEAHTGTGAAETLLATLRCGEIFGEKAALRGARREASAQAVGPCRLLRINIDTAANVMEDFGALQRQLEFMVRQRSRRRKRKKRGS